MTAIPPGTPVLIVDDEEGLVLVLGDYLESKGFTTFRASDGPSGLEIARNHPEIQLAVLDYDMPGMNGGQVLDELNAIQAEQGRRISCIFLSAQTDSMIALEVLRKNAFLYISKPVNLKQLVSSLEQAWGSLTAGA